MRVSREKRTLQMAALPARRDLVQAARSMYMCRIFVSSCKLRFQQHFFISATLCGGLSRRIHFQRRQSARTAISSKGAH